MLAQRGIPLFRGTVRVSKEKKEVISLMRKTRINPHGDDELSDGPFSSISRGDGYAISSEERCKSMEGKFPWL